MTVNKNTAVAALGGILAVASAAPAIGYEAGDWLVRGRVIVVDPHEDSGTIKSGAGPLAGSGAGVDSSVVPEVDFSYMLTPNWGLELILASSEHDARGTAPWLRSASCSTPARCRRH